MSQSELIFFAILFVAGFVSLLLISVILRPLVFLFEPLFSLINYVIWLMNNPLRVLMKNTNKGGTRGFFIIASITGVHLVWFVFFYVVTFPFRVITAIYYDVLLFLAVAISDSIQELLHPKRGGFRYKKGVKYLMSYVVTFPFRFLLFCFNNGVYLLDSVLMLGVSIVMPTLTMKHGTDFKTAGTKITQSGNWYVGAGNFAGTGVYFGMQEKVARYYAPSGGDASVILARVTLTFTKTIASLKKHDREDLSLGSHGEHIAESVKSPLVASTELWRVDRGWWEYCILRPGQMGEFINTWRVRPVALIRDGKIVRTWGGFYHYASGSGFFVGAVCWFIVFWVIGSLMQ